jgi:hypothetical protein
MALGGPFCWETLRLEEFPQKLFVVVIDSVDSYRPSRCERRYEAQNETKKGTRDMKLKTQIRAGGGPGDPVDDPPGSGNHNQRGLAVRAHG